MEKENLQAVTNNERLDLSILDTITYKEIFLKYNNRIVVDKRGQYMLVKDNKFQFPLNDHSVPNYKKKISYIFSGNLYQ